jgi:hypothetical protein
VNTVIVETAAAVAMTAGNTTKERPLQVSIVRLTHYLDNLRGGLFNNDRLRFQDVLWGCFLAYWWGRGKKSFPSLAHDRFRAIGGDG